MPHLGEICALATALCWTGSSTSFAIASRAVGGMAVNHFRLWAALPVLLLLVFVSTGRAWPTGASDERILLLGASGLAGLVLGDIGYFHALATIGPRISSVIMAAWPSIAVLLAMVAGEQPGAWLVAGLAMTTVGVVLVLLRSREGSAWNPKMTQRQWVTGVLGALLGALGQALGVLLARRGMAPDVDLPEGVDAMSATLVRMVAAALGLQFVVLAQQKPLAGLAVFGSRTALLGALVGMAFGPVLGVWLSMMATRHAAEVGVAAALMATTPIFMMPVAAVVYRARVGLSGVVGTLLCVGGVAVLLLGT